MTTPPPFRQVVRPEWIDYNGHLSEAYYVLIFGFATDALMDHVGLDRQYRDRSGCSLYTVEAHVRYLQEVPLDAELVLRTRVIDVGSKKLRLCHEAHERDDLVATEEIMALHVDGTQGASTPFPPEVADRLGQLVEPSPEYAGRSIC